MKRTVLIAGVTGLLSMGLHVQYAAAATLAPGTYQMHNHSDGSIAGPYYGLRLDGLVDRNPNSLYSFDFDAAEHGAAMYLDYDGASLHIYGSAWGGLDVGEQYQAPTLWDIDFWFVTGHGTIAGGEMDDIQFSEGADNRGTISSGHGSFELLAYAGSHDYAFQLGDEDGGGHRNHQGISGWGWLVHFPVGADNEGRLPASDFLFTTDLEPTVQAIPVPGALWLLISAMAGLRLTGRGRARAS